MNSVEQLERELALRIGAAGAVATGFGRGALYLALGALAVRGGTVLVPEFICRQVPEAVLKTGAQPVPYGVERNLTVDPEAFRVALDDRPRAAIVAHYYGRVLPGIATLAALCRDRGVPLIEDCALALGASFGGRPAGSFGDLAVFSFTKSDWCFGGGAVLVNDAGILTDLRKLRHAMFARAGWLALRYGLLRRADFAANRPGLARRAELLGRWFERLTNPASDNFYDTGRVDTDLPGLAARRAMRVLAKLDRDTRERRQILRQLRISLAGSGLLLHDRDDSEESAAFLPLLAREGNAPDLLSWAARYGVTLRLAWPAYQGLDDAEKNSSLAWFAEHLVAVELHPRLSESEVIRLVGTLRSLAPHPQQN